MIENAKWKNRHFRGDATICANEIEQIGDNVTPQQIVEFAKDESTELHKCFTWDNTEAAEKYRLHEARMVVINLVVVKQTQEEKQPVPIRLFYKTDEKEGYKPTQLIIKNESEYEKLLERVRKELQAFQMKYKHLSEFETVWEAINEI